VNSGRWLSIQLGVPEALPRPNHGSYDMSFITRAACRLGGKRARLVIDVIFQGFARTPTTFRGRASGGIPLDGRPRLPRIRGPRVHRFLEQVSAGVRRWSALDWCLAGADSHRDGHRSWEAGGLPLEAAPV